MTLYAGFKGVYLDRDALESPLFESLTEVAVYCYIQGFSAAETPEQAYYGAVDTIAEVFKISRHTAQRVLSTLENKGLITKKSRAGKTTVYRSVPLQNVLNSDPCQNGTPYIGCQNGTRAKMAQGACQNGMGTCANLAHDNKYNNKYIINNRARARAREETEPLERLNFDAALRRQYQRQAWKKKE